MRYRNTVISLSLSLLSQICPAIYFFVHNTLRGRTNTELLGSTLAYCSTRRSSTYPKFFLYKSSFPLCMIKNSLPDLSYRPVFSINFITILFHFYLATLMSTLPRDLLYVSCIRSASVIKHLKHDQCTLENGKWKRYRSFQEFHCSITLKPQNHSSYYIRGSQ